MRGLLRPLFSTNGGGAEAETGEDEREEDAGMEAGCNVRVFARPRSVMGRVGACLGAGARVRRRGTAEEVEASPMPPRAALHGAAPRRAAKAAFICDLIFFLSFLREVGKKKV